MKTMVIAPHPDDEVLGVGGVLLARLAAKEKTAWVVVTSVEANDQVSREWKLQRRSEILEVSNFFKFDKRYELNYPSSQLESVEFSMLIKSIGSCIEEFRPEEIYLPFYGDVHSDHRIVFDAAVAATKVFRCKSIKKIYAYETLSETEFGIKPADKFMPNVFKDITPFIEDKINAMTIYKSEFGVFPFPRSLESIRSLAMYRGSMSGYMFAEAYMLLKEMID